jgi:hypothetical protein
MNIPFLRKSINAIEAFSFQNKTTVFKPDFTSDVFKGHRLFWIGIDEIDFPIH